MVEKIVIYTNGDIKIIFKFEEINKEDDNDWRDWWNKDERNFLKDEIDYDTNIWWNNLNNGFFKSLMNYMALPIKVYIEIV